MFSRRIQQRVRHLVMKLMQPLARLGVTPNTLTVIGLLLSVLTAVVIAQGFLVVGGVLVLFAGIFDMFDGAVARVRNAATTFGAFFDSTFDRYSESIIFLGLLLYALQHPGLHDLLWPVANEQMWMITLIYVAMVGSLMVSYTKARAEGLGLECKTGVLARPERVVILAIGLLFGVCIWALVILAVFSNVTTIERMVSVWRTTHQSTRSEETRAAVAMQETLHVNQADTSAEKLHPSTPGGANEERESTVRPVPTSVPPFGGGVRTES